MSNKHPAQETPVLLRINKTMYEQIEKRAPAITMNADTSPQQTGFMLGVQAVLKMIRQEFVS